MPEDAERMLNPIVNRSFWMVAVAAATVGVVATAGQAQTTQAGMAFATPDGLFMVQPLDAPRRAVVDTIFNNGEGLINGLAWSPDGDRLALVKNYSRVYRLHPNQGSLSPVFSSTCPRPIDLEVRWQGDRDRLVIQQRCESADADGQSGWQVFLANAEDPASPLLSLPNTIASDPYLSPDGQQLAYVANQHIYLVALDGTPPRQVTDRPAVYSAAGSPLAWSPDGTQIAYYEGTYPFQRIGVMDVATGERRLLTPEPNFQIYRSRLVWSPDGRYLAFYQPVNPPHSNQEVIALVEVATGERQILTGPGFYNALSWSPDGRQLAFALGNQWDQQAMFVLALADRSFTSLTPQPFQTVLDSQWSPTGDWIAFTALDRGDELGLPLLHIVQPDGQRLQTLSQPNEATFPFAWVP